MGHTQLLLVHFPPCMYIFPYGFSDSPSPPLLYPVKLQWALSLHYLQQIFLLHNPLAKEIAYPSRWSRIQEIISNKLDKFLGLLGKSVSIMA